MCPVMDSSTQDKEFGSLLITDCTRAVNSITTSDFKIYYKNIVTKTA
jgi:hypothetical protein